MSNTQTQNHRMNFCSSRINTSEALRIYTNLDGKIPIENIMGGLADHGYTESEIEQVLFCMDIDGDGTISRQDWVQHWWCLTLYGLMK